MDLSYLPPFILDLCSKLISSIFKFEVKEIILLLTLIMNAVFFYKTQFFQRKNMFEARLLSIQDYSMKYPYVEDENFIRTWKTFVFLYKNDDIKLRYDEHYTRCLRYEQYCEMLFNFASYYYKCNGNSKRKFDRQIAFSDWLLSHKDWWENTLTVTPNNEIYDSNFVKLINGLYGKNNNCLTNTKCSNSLRK